MEDKNKPINKTCPNSGKPVQNDSLTEYREHCVGFCNPGCRDDFAADTDSPSKAKTFFDQLINGQH